MSILWLQREEVPADENVVRSTTYPVDDNNPPSEQTHVPEPNDVETDPNPYLGMVNRQLASVWHDPEQYAPGWQAQVDRQDEHNRIVDIQVGSSGTAAAREAAGVFGHGTMGYAIGIEPPQDLTQAGGLGNDFFTRHVRDVQDGMIPSMSIPPGYDQDTRGYVVAQGQQNARDASASAYSAWYSAVAG